MMWVRFCRASVLAVLAPIVFACFAGAQTVNWTGAASPDNTWFTPHNWLNDTPPTNGATVAFDATNLTSGSSGTYQLLAPNLYTGNTVVGGPASTYVIGTNTPFGVGGTVNYNSFNTAPTLVTINGARTLDNPMKWNSGFALGSASTGNLTLNGPITFGGDIGGQTNRTINNTIAALTVTVNGNIILGDATITPTTHNRTLT